MFLCSFGFDYSRVAKNGTKFFQNRITQKIPQKYILKCSIAEIRTKMHKFPPLCPQRYKRLRAVNLIS